MTTENKFEKPRHWVDLEELTPGYWENAKAQELRGQEFLQKPIEALEKLERSSEFGLARREFLTIMGASMAMASVSCARRPVHKIIPYVVKPEEITPGVATWYASSCRECSVGCGTLVKNREGRPIKLEGNPDHPVNEGKLCARGQASILGLYDPDRLKAPVAAARGAGSPKEMAWAEIDREIAGRLKKTASGGGAVRLLSSPVNSGSTRALIDEFLSPFGDGKLVEFEPLSEDELADAQELSYGSAAVPAYRFDRAEVVVSLGADFLGTWVSPVEHARGWAKRRKLEGREHSSAEMSRLVVFEPGFSVTGANADDRYAVRPGDELKVALALAHEIIVRKGKSPMAGDDRVEAALKGYTADAVASEIGGKLTAEALRGVATELWNKRGRSLVVAGGAQSKSQHGLALQVAVNLLNTALGNDGETVDGTSGASPRRGSFKALAGLIREMWAGKVSVLVVHRSNPVFALSDEIGFREAMAKVPMVVVVSDRLDETAVLADFVAADHHPLENWGDVDSRPGVTSLQQPAIAPLHSTRSFEDSLLAWMRAGKLGAGVPADWHQYLKARWKERVYPRYGGGQGFEEFWARTLQKGVFLTPAGAASARSFRTASLSEIPPYSKAASESLRLALYEKVSMGDGRSANNAWLQEIPETVTTVTWDNCLNVAPATARKLGLKTNDVVEVKGAGATAELAVNVLPGLHPDVVTAAVGYGRAAAGSVGNGAGVGVSAFLAVSGSFLVYAGQEVSIRRTGRRYELAATQLHHRSESRPVVNDVTLAAYRRDALAHAHTDPHVREKALPTLWPKHKYPGHRWAMSIDLNSCTGCGACTVACQAENNIPVVGRDQVRRSREMHWIRIDRYFSGSEDHPEVVFQPMLCQHCENASCETVCPVVATAHNSEGLNDMTYNRCVGTRYCQNNCPYKVRRFNYFDHWKQYQEPMNLAWNPDVTVRQRGVIEKCTFCIQRIEKARDVAKGEGRGILDGDVQTACQQTCPTDAIVFGDINDPGSKVAKLHREPRAFRALEGVGNVPMIAYQTRVRNKEESEGHVEHQ